MIQREHIEKFLKLNGVDMSSPDEEIKSVLLSARWHKEDVETALLVLRENTKSHETHVESLHRVFRSDERLKPETISALLGIDVDIPDDDVNPNSFVRRYHIMSPSQIMQIGLVSLSVSVIFVMASMWYLEMGIFHPTVILAR